VRRFHALDESSMQFEPLSGDRTSPEIVSLRKQMQGKRQA
jgi:hypothetical protein